MGLEKLPFLSARYVMNIITVAFQLSPNLGKELLQEYPITDLAQRAFSNNLIGSGQLAMQIEYLRQHYDEFRSTVSIQLPNQMFPVTGKRRDFILRHGFNPIFFSTWL